ncbi:nucleotide-diphospho-sugar transferase [Vararia minispora EC-137]|uniref:Nucleotide-diphospho-sugar transferase n=1 Tax=Vararia minispora EC-137 TaxID=1314806 RepID=A0ACB8QGB5_9AGAM|nr:nucleotide-diphospho-sugar transferase [Vararia minispora EC-137]
MQGDSITYAILLPITSRGLENEDDCLRLLERFTRCLKRTTHADIHECGGTHFCFRVYLAIDHDDTFILSHDARGRNRAEAILQAEGVDHATLVPPPTTSRGHVCELWRLLARRGAQDACDYFVLMSADVELQDAGWMHAAHAEFAALASACGVPAGFGCVVFTDTSFPGMPTFPIVSSTHMGIFGGEIVPAVFKNQDGDSFLFQLYRRWGCARMIASRLSNGIGGGTNGRYNKFTAVEWTFETLDEATARVEDWLRAKAPAAERKLTLDVVVPSYRVQPKLLEGILNLTPSPTCTTTFIIIIDDPHAPATTALEARFGIRPDVRIRVNAQNLGASLSRNRGLYESAAEWVFFLDDDVQPAPDLLIAAECAIRATPDAAGFVGSVRFPPAATAVTAAVHLTGVLNFWDLAERWGTGGEDMPWGVTASVIVRRNIRDDVRFDTVFPKTGGGEDVDFCLQKCTASLARGGRGFIPAPDVRAVHPWWNDGRPPFKRFYMWAVGDAPLMKKHPKHTFLDAPCSAELFLLAGLGTLAGTPGALVRGDVLLVLLSTTFAACVFAANVLHDLYRHLWRDAARWADLNTPLRRGRWLHAVVLSTVIRMTYVPPKYEMARWDDFADLASVLGRGRSRQLLPLL